MMKHRHASRLHRWFFLSLCVGLLAPPGVHAQSTDGLVPRFEPGPSPLMLQRPAKAGAFFDVVGRRSAIFGYENKPFEVWTYPLMILRDFQLSFQLENYAGAFSGLETMTHIEVRPEATTITYTHAAFTVRQILFAPVDEMGVVMLLDIDSTRPLAVTASFRPDLRLMWPAGLMTGGLIWDAESHTYTIVEESRRFVGMIGAPGARDTSVMPYQEEPRDTPTRFVLETTPEMTADYLIPIVVAGSVTGREEAQATYDRLLGAAEALYRENARYYEDLLQTSLHLRTPDGRFNNAFAWAKIGTEKGLATNPMLGTGFVAGYRTAGNSERPGFAWFFGRDALWTTLALIAYGDFEAARTALDFLQQFQRDDGRIPHEVSQSAALLPWFDEYEYPWASADATPLFIIAHADYWHATGDRAYLRKNWPALQNAFAYTAATDTDGNHLVENTNVGHGWVEGGLLYPAHEEIYMQGLWIEAAESLAEMADVLGESDAAIEARLAAERTREATEATYWLDDEGFYAFATREPGSADLFEEDTVRPAVPLWWGHLDNARAQRAIDYLGGGALATDWGTRILSDRSSLYDPLSYHNGSVWPLFTGWASMGAYRYGRSHVGYQALTANAMLTYQDALGYVTELLSGDYNTAFGRSSHHQVWSEAMVVTPAVRGMLGLEVKDGARRLRFAPQLPADWDFVSIQNVKARQARYNFAYQRLSNGNVQIVIEAGGGTGVEQIELAPAFPLDAVVQTVRVNDLNVPFNLVEQGDVQHVVFTVDANAPRIEATLNIKPGTSVYVRPQEAPPGSTNQGLRVLQSRAEVDALNLVVEGLGGRAYTLYVRTSKRIRQAEGVSVRRTPSRETALTIRFDGPEGEYVRRAIRLPLE